MAIDEHLETFAGKTMYDWNVESGIQNPATSIPRIALSWEQSEAKQTWLDHFKAFLTGRRVADSSQKFTTFLQDVQASEITGLVVGSWQFYSGEEDSSQPVVEALVAAREKLPYLTALFLGDILSEENEISWIIQSDVSPLFQAFPNLQIFGVRGAQDLKFSALNHENLKTLIVESGGLAAQTVCEILGADLPELEHLELWLGTDEYGGDTTVADLQALLAGDLFPNLKTLGLRNSIIVDELAAALAGAPVVERLQTLDLSLGILTDAGAQSLLQSDRVRRLKKLDLHHHFCSAEIVSQLENLDIEVDASDPQVAEDYDGATYRYVAVSE